MRIMASCLLLSALAACSGQPPAGSAEAPPTAAAMLAGWYAAGRFQPCGRPSLDVVDPAGIDRALREAGLAGGEPVYLRLEARADAGRLAVLRILQVGSPTPVRDCAMTGTRLP